MIYKYTFVVYVKSECPNHTRASGISEGIFLTRKKAVSVADKFARARVDDGEWYAIQSFKMNAFVWLAMMLSPWQFNVKGKWERIK